MLGNCDYCSQPGRETDCTGQVCCAECWEEMKDWTLEKDADLNRRLKELNARLDKENPKIKQENGLAPDAPGIACLRCRKMVQNDGQGNWYCGCYDERKGIDSNDPGIVPIPERFMRGLTDGQNA